jgi:spore coat polysaccharide biosynthesis protein SpsF
MIAAVVQARMSSRRLPGKSLLPLAGRPALRYVLDRLERAARLDLVVVATSTDPSDDPLAAFCSEEGVECHRGPLDDVAARFGEAVERYELDAFVRISGDSPLLDQQLVDRAVDLFHDVPVVTNVQPRSFPHGQSVEVVDARTFHAALAEMTDLSDREHVTPSLYRHVRYTNFAAPEDFSDVRLVLDTPEDADRIAAMLARLERPHWDYRYDELVRLAQEI